MTPRTWLVTGCSTGFGRSLARLLLDRGERVVATARDPSTLDALVASHGDRAIALRLDVTSLSDIDAAIAKARNQFGAIDVLINNAGFGQIAVVEDAAIADTREMLETNVLGAFAMVKAVLPEMRQRRSGQIVNIASVAGLIGFPALAGYCASKFALIGFSEALAAEVRPFGIAVTVAELGPFATDFTRSMRITPPSSADYDLASLSQAAGTANWGAGEDPAAGARAMLAALDHPAPPVHLLLGRQGLDIVARHDVVRQAERQAWQGTSTLERSAPSSAERQS